MPGVRLDAEQQREDLGPRGGGVDENLIPEPESPRHVGRNFRYAGTWGEDAERLKKHSLAAFELGEHVVVPLIIRVTPGEHLDFLVDPFLYVWMYC